jgi:hypothetical protein
MPGLLQKVILLVKMLVLHMGQSTFVVFSVCTCPVFCLSNTKCVKVTLPELIAQTNMDVQSVNRLREELTKMCNWIGRNVEKYFCKEYETPGQEYVEKARSV